jgi:hypothetical protein
LSKPFRRIFRNLLTARKRFDMSGKSPAALIVAGDRRKSAACLVTMEPSVRLDELSTVPTGGFVKQIKSLCDSTIRRRDKADEHFGTSADGNKFIHVAGS